MVECGNNGRVRYITDHLDGNYSVDVGYDDHNRLTEYGSYRSYTYDAWNNLLSVSSSNGVGEAPNYTLTYATNASGAPSTNRINNFGFTFDNAGNLTNDGSLNYTFDAAGRLKTAGTNNSCELQQLRIEDMDYLYVPIGGFVIYSALMKRELLIQRKSFKVILLISAILFLAGLLDLVFHLVGKERYFVSGALLCPLITLAQYRLSRRLFLKYVKREPKDTFFLYSGEDLGKDRLFNIIYFSFAFAILIFVTGGIEALTK